jgi:hypothetical protein
MKVNTTVFRDMFSEIKGGKYSSKKIWGSIILGLVAMTYVMDGYDFYEINTHLFDAMLIAGSSLIGLTTLSGIFTKKSATTKPEE